MSVWRSSPCLRVGIAAARTFPFLFVFPVAADRFTVVGLFVFDHFLGLGLFFGVGLFRRCLDLLGRGQKQLEIHRIVIGHDIGPPPHVDDAEFGRMEKVVQRPAHETAARRERIVKPAPHTRVKQSADLLKAPGRDRPRHIVQVARYDHRQRLVTDLECHMRQFRVAAFGRMMGHGRFGMHHMKPEGVAGRQGDRRIEGRHLFHHAFHEGRIRDFVAAEDFHPIARVQGESIAVWINIREVFKCVAPCLICLKRHEDVRLAIPCKINKVGIFPVRQLHVRGKKRDHAVLGQIVLRAGFDGLAAPDRQIAPDMEDLNARRGHEKQPGKTLSGQTHKPDDRHQKKRDHQQLLSREIAAPDEPVRNPQGRQDCQPDDRHDREPDNHIENHCHVILSIGAGLNAAGPDLIRDDEKLQPPSHLTMPRLCHYKQSKDILDAQYCTCHRRFFGDRT